MRQEFGTNRAAETKIPPHHHHEYAYPDGDRTMTNGPTNSGAIPRNQELHNGVVPLARSLLESEAGQHRSNHDGEEQGSEQCESHGPCHGMKKPALDALQREDRQIRSNDNGDGVKDWTLHFVRGFTDLLARGLDSILVA